MIETGTVLQDRYLIEEQIGEGGMGAVYRAVDQRFGSRVAIKETFYQNDVLGEAFVREARLLNSLHHPVLPHVSDFFIESGGQFLVMEFIEGDDFAETLDKNGAFPVADVFHWTEQLLDALDYLHSQNPPIIHRDIKPGNLKLTERGNIVLLDFGLAKLNSNDAQGVKSVFGYSRRYSPLEQIQGTGTDARSDIFALGATVFHLLTGKPPVDVLMRASAIIGGKPDPLQLISEINDKVPQSAAEIIQTAMSLNPEARFVSVNAMRKALKHAFVPDFAFAGSVETVKTVSAVGKKTVSGNADQSFPALEAFAEQKAQISRNIERVENTENPQSVDSPVKENFQEQIVPSVKIKSSDSNERRKINPVFAIAVSLAVVASFIAAFWYAGQRETLKESETNSVVDAKPSPAAEPSPSEKASPKLDTSVKPSPEIAAQTKPKQTQKAAVEASPERAENSALPETSQKTKEISQAPEKSRKTDKPAPQKRREPQQNAPIPEVQETEREPVASIENIMTGVSSERENRREERRRERRMSREEKEERRNRRTEEILRRNRQPDQPN